MFESSSVFELKYSQDEHLEYSIKLKLIPGLIFKSVLKIGKLVIGP